MRVPTRGYAVHSADTPLGPFASDRRVLHDDDVQIEIFYSGTCHSDLHAVRNHWQGSIFHDGTTYPCVPGHEIVGRIEKLGAAVGGFTIGDLVGVAPLLCAGITMWSPLIHWGAGPHAAQRRPLSLRHRRGEPPFRRLTSREAIMPILTFDLIKGRTDAEITALLDAAHAAVLESV